MEESKIKVPPRPTTQKGFPKVRTPIDYMGNEIPIERKESSNENRTEIVKQKHENKFKRENKQTSKPNKPNRK